eukprot:c16792_g1_i1 orf=969-2129(-)
MAGLSEEEVCQTESLKGDFGSGWFFPREQIEKHSPSRKDGITLTKENQLRKSYCVFLQDLGMRLKVPQVTIATSIVFCHRFFLRQSHAKNDRYMIATACMFLAGKVEETPKLLQNVLFVSYEIRHKRDKSAVERIKQKEVYNHERERVLLAESLVLRTLDFDLNIIHPYKRLVTAVKKLKIVENSLAQVAWNFLNDGLRTSLCLQYEAHHIAAGGIFLAAKFLKIKLPTDGEKPWWQELEVTARQLEDVSNQMLELYEQHRDSTPSPRDPLAVSSTAGSEAPSEVPPGTPQVAEKRSTKAKGKAEVGVEGDFLSLHHWNGPKLPCAGLEKKSTGNTEPCEQVNSLNTSVELDNLDGALDCKRVHPRSCNQDCKDREPKRPCCSYVK